SGTHCPFLGGAYAMAIVEKEPAPLGAQVEVEIRGKRVTAEVIKSQFYKR
ncbi:MAG: glycine cleavage T C-terminal barrel domain-containing protein, partial [Negativibacillus sp.]